MIRFNQVSKQYRNDDGVFYALHDVTFQVEEGEIFGIIGMSGAGKTTILKIITGLEVPDSGSVMIGKYHLSTLCSKQWMEYRKSIGVIHQGYHLLMQRTVFQNIAFPLEINHVSKEETQRRVMELLEIVGLVEKAHQYPATLSGGQKQRVAIARALATNPKVLLCDEPTSALDLVTSKGIVSLLQLIRDRFGVSIVLISHELGIIRSLASQVMILDQGKICEVGKTSDVFSNPISLVGKHLLGRG
ncbi:MAG: ATP-binding cassette domain-containing protein [Candidatus Izemoplasmatales bacterium]|nr:ATP-binding cassette domain-containing protein [bacterium]MDZ4196984.1 ATP-binding cassette domain-containing protein [Candidatus Izemoplasmatales bacterium]